jgi:hypothetical protein
VKKFQITKPKEQNTGQAESAALRHAIAMTAVFRVIGRPHTPLRN